jgi:hypothetical protein
MTYTADQIIARMSIQSKISDLFANMDSLKKEIYSMQITLIELESQENPNPKDIHLQQDLIALKQTEVDNLKSAIENLTKN